MKIVYNQRSVAIDWLITTGINRNPEDFSRADVEVFLIGNGNRYCLQHNDSSTTGHLNITIPGGALDPGMYDIKAVWFKTRGGVIKDAAANQVMQVSGLCNVLAMTNESYEDNTGDMTDATYYLSLHSHAEPYGYDGMSAYEIACFHGNTLDEETWVKRYEGALDNFYEALDEFDERVDVVESDGWVTSERISSDSILTDKIADNAVTEDKIADEFIERIEDEIAAVGPGGGGVALKQAFGQETLFGISQKVISDEVMVTRSKLEDAAYIDTTEEVTDIL